MAIKFPKVRGERLIIAALAMILVAEAITTFCHLDDGKVHFGGSSVESLSLFGSFLLIVSLITTGIRKMRRDWPSYSGITMLLIGLLLCAIPLYSINMYKNISKNIEDISKPHFYKMESIMKEADLPLDKRIKLSQIYAKDKYFYEGVIVSYLTDNGKEARFVPTKEDVELRNLKNSTLQSIKNVNKSIPSVTFTWIAIPVISGLLGALTPIRNGKTNTRSDQDRGN
ncbi:hypothetical protein L4X63_11550 [Geomonas sp. Red32]|uniref:hypothetical protein n=1 Tax=Geomonas sp. Red32 TaxID=2912856 RepID=UPI00202CBFDB|nr:hypothetical protein [Geomonas sp. Red32]MCM0082225.1 hypothetical protein [Geomonas sp. Red32]